MSRPHRPRARDEPVWFAWPLSIALFLVGLGGLVSFAIRKDPAAVAFTLVWLVALVWISKPHRKAWRERR